MTVTFAKTIRPYFTPCYRAHMIHFASVDLWNRVTVVAHWQKIWDRVSIPAGTPGSMPAPGCGEGVWDDITRAQFLADFQAWKDNGFS